MFDQTCLIPSPQMITRNIKVKHKLSTHQTYMYSSSEGLRDFEVHDDVADISLPGITAKKIIKLLGLIML